MSCPACKFGKFERTATGRPKRNLPGRCTFELGALVVPIVMTIQPRMTAIWPDMGADCPTYTLAPKATKP